MENLLNELDANVRTQVETFFANTDRFFNTIRNAHGQVAQLGNAQASRVADDVLAQCNTLATEFNVVRAAVTGQNGAAAAGAITPAEIQTLRGILNKLPQS